MFSAAFLNAGRRSLADSGRRIFRAATRPEKVEAIATTSSLSFSRGAASGRGAGPSITSAALLGSTMESWQEQTNALRCGGRAAIPMI